METDIFYCQTQREGSRWGVNLFLLFFLFILQSMIQLQSFMKFRPPPFTVNFFLPSFHFGSISIIGLLPRQKYNNLFFIAYLLIIHEEQDGHGHLSKEDNQQQEKELRQSRDMLIALILVLPSLPLHPGSIQTCLHTCTEVPISACSGLHKPFVL